MESNPIESNQQSEIKKAALKNAFILGLFALVSTGLIAITHLLTKDKIAAEVELSLIRKLSEIVEPNNYNNDVYNSCILVHHPSNIGSTSYGKVYRMRYDNINYGLMMTLVSPDGYSGPIEIAMAIKTSGEIIGINILSHKETPGLGDKIERKKSHWLNQFNGLSLSGLNKKDWQVKKDGGHFDALTGATITPRAVITSVYKGLQFIQRSDNNLYERAPNCYVIEDNLSRSNNE